MGPETQPLVVAELSGNHAGDLTKALRLIEEAKSAGADAVKLQTYTPDTLTIASNAPDFRIMDGLWAGMTLHDLYRTAHTPWDWHETLFQHARELGLIVFSTAFDSTAIDLLEDLDAPVHKIASFELVDHALVRYAASTGKPLIISTGLANIEEIGEAVGVAREAGCRELALLHCVSGYPAPAEDYNLRTIPDLAERFGVVVGLSDHSLTNTTAIASVAMGASLIEKHVTLDRGGGGPDDRFSIEPPELADLCEGVSAAWQALGTVHYGLKSSEESSIRFRRSLYFIRDLSAGSVIGDEDVRAIRPGYGLAPKHLGDIIGATVVVDVERGQPVTWNKLG